MGEIWSKRCEGVGITWKTPPSDSNTAENRSSSERWSAQYWREPWEPISSEVQPTQRTVRSGRMLSRSERSSLLFEPTFEKLSESAGDEGWRAY